MQISKSKHWILNRKGNNYKCNIENKWKGGKNTCSLYSFYYYFTGSVSITLFWHRSLIHTPCIQELCKMMHLCSLVPTMEKKKYSEQKKVVINQMLEKINITLLKNNTNNIHTQTTRVIAWYFTSPTPPTNNIVPFEGPQIKYPLKSSILPVL